MVADFGSTDHHPRGWIGDVLGPIPWQVITVRGAFSRGRGLNIAGRAARHDALLFLDADMLICPEVVTYSREVAAAGAAYFPVCWSLGNRAGSYGWWRHKGWGNCAMSRDLWARVGGWKEHERWGGEDDAMRDALGALGVSIIRAEVDGFVHQFHPKRMRHVGVGFSTEMR